MDMFWGPFCGLFVGPIVGPLGGQFGGRFGGRICVVRCVVCFGVLYWVPCKVHWRFVAVSAYKEQNLRNKISTKFPGRFVYDNFRTISRTIL